MIGMACTILIFLWVQDELTYDKFHTNHKNIYQVIAHRDFNNSVFTDRNMVLPMAKSLEAEYPQIKNAVVTTYGTPAILEYGETKLRKKGRTVSEHFFNMFTWKFIQGSASTAIKDPSSIVLTESAARSLFGNADPMNKVVKMDNANSFTVTAIVADPPGNSSFQFDYIKLFNYSDPRIQASMNEWTNSSWNVFVQIVPGANINTIEKSINDLKKRHTPDDKISTYFAFPMSKWRLYSDFKDGKNIGGMIEYVKLFSVIAVIILLIACINFMNLSTARSEKRAKEVGIRKTLGSQKKQLISQFFFESMILALAAFAFALLAVVLLLPAFNLLVDKHLTIPVNAWIFWAGGLAIVVFTGIVAGSYPALYLSSFNPIKVLKGTFLSGRKAVMPRRILVVSQFVISILLISATIIVHQQIQHVRDRDMGYNPNNLVEIPSTNDIQDNFKAIRQDLLNTGLISAVTKTGSTITATQWRSGAPDWKGKPANADIIVSAMSTDVDFTKTMGVKILAGKDFAGVPADSASMMLNKRAVEIFGLKEPIIGMPMQYGRRNYIVTGITDNIVMESPYKPVEPMMIFYNPWYSSYLSVRLKEGVLPQKGLAAMETIMKKHNPGFPFEYRFVNEEFNKKFLTEELISKITNIFAGLGIFICCIGLAGLASFTIEKRFREIGIRKVLGASVQNLLMLISKEFLKLVMIAFVIAVPLTWWFMNDWLQKYDYRISISIWLFGIVGIAILLLTLVVVGLNTLRAAIANPVKSLRTE
jgi:ABC-type antimicrobial peptide transport system permease subunit